MIKGTDSVKIWVQRHSHHIVFSVSILSLSLLVTWWSVFIYRSINERRTLQIEKTEAALSSVSMRLQLGKDINDPPDTGLVEYDDRFEISRTKNEVGQLEKPLAPLWPDLCVKAKKSVAEAIQKQYLKSKFMLIGESILLVLLILLSSIMLYQFIQLEKRSTREIEEFWGRVTHEIKTPITGLKAFLQSLKNKSLNPARLPTFVDMALKQVEKQEQLAENILAGYVLRHRTNDEPHDQIAKSFNLPEWLKRYFNNHVIHLTDAKLLLNIEAYQDPQKPLLVKADFHILKVILDNVVDNALKYCSPGLILTVELVATDRKAVITIRDNGPGFHPPLADKIFKAYKHLDRELPGSSHGSGMGLYISKKLAEKMGGALEASSHGNGQGATFQLFLNRSKT
jgi:signal transduction histidine kinase